MVVKNANIHNIMGGMESTGGVRLHNHRRKLKQRFDIIRKLGQGTYGKVQLGINKETGQEVAIKTIKKAKIETEADLIRIRREIQIMSSVQHPNIIHIYEVFENREKMVLVMEYAAGGELYDYLSERKVLPQDEARRIFRQIATAVFYCHKHKICHRDLKLENILLDEHGSAKIADFGLSNVFDEQRLLNTFCGSPLYASPEIVKGTPYHGPEVDCWSLGVLLYTLVYGAMPFDGSNFKRLVKQISQGDYFEPKKPSPASSLIRDMLTVPPAKRADIEKVCSHWWVNEGYSDSCLQIAEELADQTPVRLDLLLSLAPPPSGVGTENIMQQGMSNTPSVPHAMVPTRCHSVGSLMELDHTATEQQQQQQQQRTFGAIGKQPLYGDSVAQSAQSTSCATTGHWDSTKRKLEEGASSSEVNLRGAVKRDRGKRKSYEESADVQMSSGRTKHSGENEMEEQTTSEVQPEDEKMDIEEISDPVLPGAAHAPESMESSELSKDSGVEIQDDSLNTSEMEHTCKSSTVSSTATIIPAEESSSAMPSPDEHVSNEPTLSDNNKIKKPIKKKAESVSDLKMSGDLPRDLEKSRSAVANEKKDSVPLKEPSKGVSGTKEKQKKVSNAEVSEASKTSKVIAKNDTGNAVNKTSKAVETVVNSSKNISASGGKDEKENEMPKTSTKAGKSKGDLVLENLNSEASSTPNTSEPSTPPAGTMERRRSKIFETADKFNNILSGSPETKNVARDKPKKLFIPGVKVSDFKKAFERKLSSPEISVAAFSKKYPTKSDEITSEKSEKPQNGENENNVNGIQKGTSSASDVHENNLKGKPTGSAEGEQVQDDSKGKKSKSGRNYSHVTEDNKKENTVDSNKSKPLKTPSETKKSSKSVINKSSDSAVEGRNLETMQPAANTVDSTDIKAKTENDKDQELLHNDKKVIPTETVVSAQDAGNDVTIKPSKPNEAAGKKKSSKVEITLKSATLPRRKTSKAEIKLDPAIPPIEYKTEIEHMVNTPTTVPLHIRRSDEEHAVPETTMPFRSWSLEPESPHLGKMPSHECIIPIQIERETREGSNLMSPPVGRPPAYPFQQRSMSQSQRSSTLSRQSTQESDSEVMEPIRKSPREYIIPIAVEGGGYVTPRAGSLEPSASDDAKSRRSMSSTRSNHYRRMSSLLSDTSEDEGFNMSPGGLQRHGSLSRGRDDGRTFHFHRLRSSRPMRHSLEHTDSLSSAEEDDDDDDDEGFEILTAESLFSTLLSRVRSLTQRLTVEDGKRPGFPSNHFVNQLSNINNPSTSFKNFYSHHREPLSRRLSETSSFPRLLNRGGDFGPMHQRSLSRDSSNCDSVNSEASCTVGTFPRGPSNQKYNPCDNIRRGTRNIPTSYQYTSGVPRGAGWQNKHPDESNSNNPYLFPESSVMKSSSSGKNLCKLPSHNYQSHHSPRKLTRTLSLRSTAEDKLFCNSPVEENIYNKYSDGFLSDKHNQNIDLQLPSEAFSTTPAGYKREKLRSSSRQNLTSLSRDFKTPDTPSGYILPPLPQSSISETKCNSIPRPTHVSRIPGQERFNKGVTKNTRIDSYQPQPKHSSSLPSIVEGPKSLKYKGTMTSGNLPLNSTESQGAYSPSCSADIKKISDKKLNNSEYSVNNASLINKKARSPECKSESKAIQNICDGEECTKNNKILSPQQKDTQSSRTTNSSVNSQSRSLKPGKQSLIPKSSSGSKQGKDNGSASILESTDKEDGSTVQKRRISRFLRPDFFDTPPEESTYVKEREAKKAAEAEIKKAKRLARRTSSMRETSNIKTDTHDKKNSNISERPVSLSKNDSNKTGNTFHKNSEIHLANMDNHNEKIKQNPKLPNSPLSHSDDKCNKNQTWNSPQKGDVLRTSGSGLCASAKSRVGKAISSLQEHNFTPWDKKIVATESTYLKRAVSVDDVSLKSQSSLIKTNPKLGRKISSVLGLFSKMDNPALENQYLSNTLQIQNDGEIAKSYCDQIHSQNEVKTSVPSSNSLEKGKNKEEEKKQTFGSNFSIGEAENGIKNMKQPKSLKDSKNKIDLKKNNKKVAAQVISDALCNTKDPSKKTLNSNPPDLKGTIASTEKIQAYKVDVPHEQDVNKKFLLSNSSPLPAHTDESSNISKYITDNKLSPPMVSSVDNENCEQPSLLVSKESALPVTNDSKYFSKVTNINSENSPADETESVDSWCASSDIDAQENLGLPGDDDDKESESVEDRIRRKSFYSRFNDVKKKGRKKSSQFLKDCRTTLLPTNYHKNDNQAFLPQSSNTGAVSKKLPVPSHTTETHKDLGDTNTVSITSSQNSMPESNKTNEVCSLEGKEISLEKNRILDNVSNAANDNTSNTRALLRPAAFAQSVLKKTPPVKGKTQTQPQDGSTTIPKLSDPVSGASNTVLTSENTKQKEEMATS